LCGIVGFIGKQAAAPVLLSTLARLEYRGYDSAGVATVFGGELHLSKGTGKLEEVESCSNLSRLPGTTGIGHVRWATHGAVNTENAHPHCDCQHCVAVVHNGIIDNYEKLKNRLNSHHKFLSQTDTEVIAHLIEEYLLPGVSLEQAVCQAVKELRGTYALVVTSTVEPDKLVACRNGSPLVVGIGKGENFIASDFQAFLDITREVLFIEDGECVVLTRDRAYLHNLNGKKIHRAPEKLDIACTIADKDGYEYYTLKEIFEQPRAIMAALKQDKIALNQAAALISESRSLVFTACGSSRYAALIGRYLFSKIAHRLSDVIMASEFGYFGDAVDADTLVIAVSQSGETADVIEGVKEAKARGAKVLSVINTMGSTLARMSDRVLYLNCGPEIGVAATKSFLCQLVIFYLISAAMAGRLEEVEAELASIASLIEDKLLLNNSCVPDIALKLQEKDKFYYISRGINYAVAGEGALKLKELAYVHAEGMPAGELKHGTLALVEEGTPVIAIAPCDGTREHILSNIAEVKARGAYVIGVSDYPCSMFDAYIEVPFVDELYYPLVSIIPLQLFAFHSAIARGLDPDRPRNLAKSVTVR
jgi:glutamine---fructose-6-phosphate transaminase (isomerizing)